MNTPNKLAPVIALALGVTAPITHAAVLPDGAILQITDGVAVYDSYGNVSNVTSGSWFGMDTDKNSRIAGTEKIPLISAGVGGVIIGSTQSAAGSHGGGIDGSENPAFDIWEFFGNTGMNYTRAAPSGNTTTGLNLSGWTVTWNAIPAIDMGTGAWNPLNCVALGISTCSFSNGVAQISWSGVSGDPFELWYTATVPVGDVSGFGGVQYMLHLVGTVVVPGTVTSSGTLGNGTSGGTAANNYRATATLPTDTGYTAASQAFDYTVDCGAPACNANVIIPLTTPVPSGAVLRKYNPNTSTWSNFDTSVAPDAYATADSATGGGDCAAAAYGAANVLTAGHDCLRITQAEGGPNDTDTTAGDGIYGDPVVIATASAAVAATDLSSGSSGCTLSSRPASIGAAGDWLLVGAALAGLGLFRRRIV